MKATHLKLAIVRQEYAELTGDFYLALVLNQFSYYQMMARDVERYRAQENEHAELSSIGDGYIEPTHGWFYKSAGELCEELMDPFKKSKAHELVLELIEMGYVITRSNPRFKYDRVKQYRVDLVKLTRDLTSLGFSLPGWRLEGWKSIPPGGNHISATRPAIQQIEVTSEKPNLNPSQGKDFHSSLPGNPPTPPPADPPAGAALASPTAVSPAAGSPIPGNPETWPAIRNPAMPRRDGVTDWISAVKTYDEALAREFSVLFPNQPGPLEDGYLVRRYWKCRKGLLTPRLVRQLVAYHSEIQVPEGTTWANNFKQVLMGRYLTAIAGALAEARAERLSDLELEGEMLEDVFHCHTELEHYERRIHELASSPPMTWLDVGVFASLLTLKPAYCGCFAAAWRRSLPGRTEALAAYHDKIAADIRTSFAWLQWADHHNVDPVEVWGLTRDEIVALQNDARADLQRRIDSLP